MMSLLQVYVIRYECRGGGDIGSSVNDIRHGVCNIILRPLRLRQLCLYLYLDNCTYNTIYLDNCAYNCTHTTVLIIVLRQLCLSLYSHHCAYNCT